MKKLFVFIAILVFMGLFFYPEIKEARAGGDGFLLSGGVYNNSNPVTYANVFLKDGVGDVQATTQTNEMGLYEFSNVPNGEYYLNTDGCMCDDVFLIMQDANQDGVNLDCVTPTPTPTLTPEPTGEPDNENRSPSGGVGYIGDCAIF